MIRRCAFCENCKKNGHIETIDKKGECLKYQLCVVMAGYEEIVAALQYADFSERCPDGRKITTEIAMTVKQ